MSLLVNKHDSQIPISIQIEDWVLVKVKNTLLFFFVRLLPVSSFKQRHLRMLKIIISVEFLLMCKIVCKLFVFILNQKIGQQQCPKKRIALKVPYDWKQPTNLDQIYACVVPRTTSVSTTFESLVIFRKMKSNPSNFDDSKTLLFLSTR